MKKYYTFYRDAYITIEAESLKQAWEIASHLGDDAWKLDDARMDNSDITTYDPETGNKWMSFSGLEG